MTVHGAMTSYWRHNSSSIFFFLHVGLKKIFFARTGMRERRNGLCGCCFWHAVCFFFVFFCMYGHARAKERPMWLLFLASDLKVFYYYYNFFFFARTGKRERRKGLCGCCFWHAVWKFFFFFARTATHVRPRTYGPARTGPHVRARTYWPALVILNLSL